MANYETDEEQVEAIKKWWVDNGQSVLIGALLGFGLLFGWRGWNSYTQGQSELASYKYEQVSVLASQNKADEMTAAAQQLLSEYPNSTYSALTALLQAQHSVRDDQNQAAQAHLQWVIDNTDLSDLQDVARLRKARLLVAEREYDAAHTLLQAVSGLAYEGLKAELQGDIYLAKNSSQDALAEYEKALKNESLSPQHQRWIEMKRDSLGSNAEVLSAANVLPVELMEAVQKEQAAAEAAAQTAKEEAATAAAAVSETATSSTSVTTSTEASVITLPATPVPATQDNTHEAATPATPAPTTQGSANEAATSVTPAPAAQNTTNETTHEN